MRRAFRIGPQHDDRLYGGPVQANGPAQDQHRIGPLAAHQPVGNVNRYLGQRRQCDHCLFEFIIGAQRRQRRLVQPAGAVKTQHDALRGIVVARTDAGADLLGDFRQHAVNLRLAAGCRRDKQAIANHGGRFGQQFAEHRLGDIGPQADLLGQDAVVFGAPDEADKAILGNPGTAIVGDAAHDLAIAATHQHIGHRHAERRARRDGLQMGLAFGCCDTDKIGFTKPRRIFEYRARDGDIVVVGERAQHLDRRVADRSKVARQLGTRLGLDLLDQQTEDVVEHVDMGVAVALGAVKEESRDALQRVDALRARTVPDDVFKLGDQRDDHFRYQ